MAGTTAATQMQSGVTQGGVSAGQIIAGQMTMAGQQQGLLSGVGGIGGLVGMVLPGLFSEGGYSSTPVASAALPASLFTHAPHFSQGGLSDGGIPAVLHPNEAVVPLSRGRKIPVDLGEAGGGGGGRAVQSISIVQQISTPDAGSFRKSQKQIANEMGAATQRAMKSNG